MAILADFRQGIRELYGGTPSATRRALEELGVKFISIDIVGDGFRVRDG